MHVNDISRQQFSKIASRGLAGRMNLTEPSRNICNCSGVCYGAFVQLVQLLEQGETLD